MTNMICFFIGTTAELIKIFPVIKELETRKKSFKIISSGQTNIDFNEVSRWIGRRGADISLSSKLNRPSVFHFLVWAVKTTLLAPFYLSREFAGKDKKSAVFIIHGDTVSSLVGALSAKLVGLKLVHIESGLRSFDFFEPFPEELCRFLISKMANVHFCPNRWSINNLHAVQGTKVNTYQNTFLESFSMAFSASPQPLVKKLAIGKYFVFVLHRQEHIFFGRDRSRQLAEFVLKNKPVGMKCLFIKHVTTTDFLESVKGNFVSVPHLPYVDFVYLLKKAEFMITDGGGNQEEAYYMGKPCLILRNRTERIEGLGENAILAKDKKTIIKLFLKNYKGYKRKMINTKISPSKIIVNNLP